MLRLSLASVALLAALVTAAPAPAQNPEPLVKRLGQLPKELVKAGRTDAEIVDALCLAAVARLPKDHEKEFGVKHIAKAKSREAGAQDIAWALINTKEFLQLHGLDKDIPATLGLLNKYVEEWNKEDKKEAKKEKEEK